MNKISKLLLSSFFGPFVITFIVSILLFELQFIWLYVDEMMGKGIDTLIIIEVLIYKSSELVSYALPLAILMSSIMTLGNLSENYELAALKSAGIGLFRILRPLTILMVVISFSAFFFANNIWPIANLKFHTLLYSVTKQKPMLTLEENVFYNGIDGLSIRAGKKDVDTGELEDVVIYDYKNTNSTLRVIRAEKGTMQKTGDERFLVMTLENGVMYDEQIEETATTPGQPKTEKNRPHIRSSFEKDVIRYDLSSLFFVKQDENLFDNRPKMMTIKQLNKMVDSLDVGMDEKIQAIDQHNEKSLLTHKLEYDIKNKEERMKRAADIDSSQVEMDQAIIPEYQTEKEKTPLTEQEIESIKQGDFLAGINPVQEKRIYNQAHKVVNTQLNYYKNIVAHQESVITRKRTYNIEFHRKFYLGFSCLVLFFIGAPLGAILRKGGIGYPAIFALLFFMLYYIINVIGERMVKAGTLEAWQGMWMSSLILFPLGIFLTYKAATDASIMDKDAYIKFFNKLLRRNKKLGSKT